MMLRACRWLALGCALLAPATWAQQQPVDMPPLTPPAEALPPAAQEPDLYLEALQAISDGRKSDAGAILTRMVQRGARNAGELLDLAMLQCALGRADEAEALFVTIETTFKPPKGLQAIIDDQRRQGCIRWKRQQQWGVNVARGYDHNVNQGASNPNYSVDGGELTLPAEYRPKADHYATVTLDYVTDLSENGDLAYVQLYGRRNDHEFDHNTISAFGGIDHPWRWGRWKWRASGLAGALTLGGKIYQTQTQAQLRLTPPLPLPPSMELSLVSGLTHLKYRTLTNFDSNTTELRSILSHRGDDHYAQLSAGAMRDHAVASRPGGDRNGWSFGVSTRQALGHGLEAELDWNALQWNGQRSYSPGLIDAVRRQNSRTLRASLSYAVTRNSAIQLEWRAIRNKENISIFQYDNRIVQLSWRWRDGK